MSSRRKQNERINGTIRTDEEQRMVVQFARALWSSLHAHSWDGLGLGTQRQYQDVAEAILLYDGEERLQELRALHRFWKKAWS